MKQSIRDMARLELGQHLRQIVMAIVLAAICIAFSILSDGMFTSPRNLSNLMLQATATATAAIGVVLVLVAGHIDLSIGSFVGLVGAVCAVCMVQFKLSTMATILVALGCGVLLGAWQGYWIAYRRIPAFIVTLAGMQMFRGGALMVTGGVTLSPMNDNFKAIGQGYIPGILSNRGSFNDTALLVGLAVCAAYILVEIRRVRARRRYGLEVADWWFIWTKTGIACLVILGVFLVMALHLGISIAVVAVGVLALIFSFLCANTSFGKSVYALGGNKDAAMLSGINIKRTTFAIYIVMGVMCALSAIIYTARINSATSSAGQGMEMDAIAAAIIGGTSTMGGEGSVMGAIIGALIMTSIDNGMSIMNLPPQVQYIAKGMVLLLAVWLDVATRKQSK